MANDYDVIKKEEMQDSLADVISDLKILQSDLKYLLDCEVEELSNRRMVSGEIDNLDDIMDKLRDLI